MSTVHDHIRVWFITGTSQGIGRALLEELLISGDRVVATLRNPTTLSSLSSQYPSTQLLILPLDVANPSQITSAFEATKIHFGRIDVLVNNAGYGLQGEIETTPDEEARKVMEVLFWGPVNICKQAIPFMRDINPSGTGGLILNVSTVGGYSANPGLAFYSAGKFALEGFTESLTKEMHPKWNIKAHILELGGFRTEWSGSSMKNLPTLLSVYASEDSPTEKMRRIRSEKYIGDPGNAAKAFRRIAEIHFNGNKDGSSRSDGDGGPGGEGKLPLRIQLGTDSSLIVGFKAKQTMEDARNWEDFAATTNADDVDKEKLVERLKMVFS